MSLRIDTAELISGAYVVGDTGLGVLGADIPSTGLHGASFLYNCLTLPDDAEKEIRGQVLSHNTSGYLFVWEDGSFTLSGAPNGNYSITFRLYADGVDLGTATVLIYIGPPTLRGAVFLGGISVSGSLGVAGIVTGTYPQPAEVLIGILYGPTGAEYVGTLTFPTANDIADAVWAKVLP